MITIGLGRILHIEMDSNRLVPYIRSNTPIEVGDMLIDRVTQLTATCEEISVDGKSIHVSEGEDMELEDYLIPIDYFYKIIPYKPELN